MCRKDIMASSPYTLEEPLTAASDNNLNNNVDLLKRYDQWRPTAMINTIVYAV